MRPVVIEKEKVIEYHETCQLSQAEISRLLNCTQGYVNAVLRNAGIGVANQVVAILVLLVSLRTSLNISSRMVGV